MIIAETGLTQPKHFFEGELALPFQPREQTERKIDRQNDKY